MEGKPGLLLLGTYPARRCLPDSVRYGNRMDFAQYQEASARTLYPAVGDDGLGLLTRLVLGLNGEAGEAAEHMKKTLRDDGGVLTEERRQLLLKELGDTLWYVAQAASALDSSLEEVATANIAKLASRAQRGAVGGSGDNR